MSRLFGLALSFALACAPSSSVDESGPGDGDGSSDGGVAADGGAAADGGSEEEQEATVSFLGPGAAAENPVTFSVATTGPIHSVEYVADGKWSLGSSTAAGEDFAVTYSFSTQGLRSIEARGSDAGGALLATATLEVEVSDPATEVGDGMGAWLWYIEGVDMTHAELADRLADLGFRRVLVKVADGAADCGSWPELCDASVPATYQAAGLEAWAWAYNYPGSATSQASALTQAAATGYDGFVLDIETEFDGASTTLESLLVAFADARDDAVAAGTADAGFVLAATTWGNPMDHDMRVDIIDRYVDLHMPQTYVEVWGSSYMASAGLWVQTGTCEYRVLGATKPVRHIVSTEYGDITAAQITDFLQASGPGSSVWRVPGGGTPTSIWNTWEAVDWELTGFDAEPSCD